MLAHLTGWPFFIVIAAVIGVVLAMVHGTALLLDRPQQRGGGRSRDACLIRSGSRNERDFDSSQAPLFLGLRTGGGCTRRHS